jgi:hypothetical protein
MIYINPDEVILSHAWSVHSRALTAELLGKSADERTAFINRHRDETWAHPAVLVALRSVVGNKCWYSEVPLEGGDPNVDHFRPKGQVREVDDNFEHTGEVSPGYWWLAFESRNFRLAAVHANQRRVDESTVGGKWDYFPVRGERAPAPTDWGLIAEDHLALDPCSSSDVRLLWFDPDGNPCASLACRSQPDQERVRATIWLYHLDKEEILRKRANHLDELRKDLRKADIEYQLWAPESTVPNLHAKNAFDIKVAEIRRKISDRADFAGAKRCAVRLAITEYPWIDEFIPIP